ncbi:hypothetical protein LCGC14_1396390 [marine sediment metagenome]|uniref:Uncharacterized protein n=1 Tax=marine sediment metagenome TaxID=412755 RepID=A0A0F9JYI8_9ZZZZ
MGIPRSENRADVTIAGVTYQVVPGAGNFVKGTNRSLLQQQALQAGGSTTRSDMRPIFQTSWAGGSRWENPLLHEANIDAYFISEGFDMISTPGDLVAIPDTVQSASTDTINDNTFTLARSPSIVYYFETQKANMGLIKYDGSTFAALTNDFGNNANALPIAMCWDPVLSTVFALFHEVGVATTIRFITPDSAGSLVGSPTGGYAPGANIFMHNGRLMVYTGVNLQEIGDPLGSPTTTTIFDDGMGGDYLDGMVDNASDPIIHKLWSCTLSVASAEGVWIVKNTIQQGLPTPFIYRIDRDQAGTDIGVPVATLPPGTVALDIYMHLGSLIISTTSDVATIMFNDISNFGHAQTTFYHYSKKNGLATIGSALGTVPDETVYKFLGADVARLWIGGFERRWIYDAVRGGLHPIMKDSVSTGGGAWSSMVRTSLSTEDIYMFGHEGSSGSGGSEVQHVALHRDEAGNAMTHEIESPYFDGGLPAELKEIISVTLMTDGIQANETWTVTFAADDAAFGSSEVFDTDNDTTVTNNLGTPLSGYRFRYKLAYTASADISTPSVVKGIVIRMVQGEFLQQWRMKLRMSDSANVGNKVVRGETQQTNLEALSVNQSVVTFIDNYRQTAATTQVRVQSALIDKSSPNQGEVDVVLVEHSTT